MISFRSAVAALGVLMVCGQPLSAAVFINTGTIPVASILRPPPQPGTAEYRTDLSFLKNARATATKKQLLRGVIASHDGVFDYSQTLGPWFTAKNLPVTAALFGQITDETKEAIELAKTYFARTRPETWKETGDPEKSNGYAYPSGHTTRAFVWANLLANAFPDMKKPLHLQARQKAWYRVILGRHFPNDVHAGKLYGTYLATQFLKSPEFQKEWPAAVAEMKRVRKQSRDTTPHPITQDAPDNLKL
jgi:acid phosphatase (class A)